MLPKFGTMANVHLSSNSSSHKIRLQRRKDNWIIHKKESRLNLNVEPTFIFQETYSN